MTLLYHVKIYSGICKYGMKWHSPVLTAQPCSHGTWDQLLGQMLIDDDKFVLHWCSDRLRAGHSLWASACPLAF